MRGIRGSRARRETIASRISPHPTRDPGRTVRISRFFPAVAVPVSLLAVAAACQPPAAGPSPVGYAASVPAGCEGVDAGALVDVRLVDPTIVADIRYATRDNFTGAPLPGYEVPLPLLRPEAAGRLARVQARLRPQGLGLKVFDGYRPVRATLEMVRWAEHSDNGWMVDQGYIARESGHNRGATVDLTLIRLSDGGELEMGTPYDAFSEAAHTANATGAVAANRQTLVAAMAAEGFVNLDKEWWHYRLPSDDPPMDAPHACFAP